MQGSSFFFFLEKDVDGEWNGMESGMEEEGK